MSVGVVQLATQTNAGAHKQAKVEEQERNMTLSAEGPSIPDDGSPALDSGSQDGTVDNLKKQSEYKTKDLPVPSDQRWSRGVIGTLTLWCGIQSDIWVIPDEAFVKALQGIFNVVYPAIKHHIVINGVVYAVVSVL